MELMSDSIMICGVNVSQSPTDNYEIPVLRKTK